MRSTPYDHYRSYFLSQLSYCQVNKKGKGTIDVAIWNKHASSQDLPYSSPSFGRLAPQETTFETAKLTL